MPFSGSDFLIFEIGSFISRPRVCGTILKDMASSVAIKIDEYIGFTSVSCHSSMLTQ